MALARCQSGMLRTALRAQTASLYTSSYRFNSTLAAAESSSAAAASSSTSAQAPETESALPSEETLAERATRLVNQQGLKPVRYTYFVPRVGRMADSLPVYTDVRNGGTRILTEVRRVEGNLADLRSDLLEYLAPTYQPTSRSTAAALAKLAAEEIAAEPHIPYLPHNGRTPHRVRVARKAVAKRGKPSAIDPVQPSVVLESGKLKVRGNRVREIKDFLEAKGF